MDPVPLSLEPSKSREHLYDRMLLPMKAMKPNVEAVNAGCKGGF